VEILLQPPWNFEFISMENILRVKFTYNLLKNNGNIIIVISIIIIAFC